MTRGLYIMSNILPELLVKLYMIRFPCLIDAGKDAFAFSDLVHREPNQQRYR